MAAVKARGGGLLEVWFLTCLSSVFPGPEKGFPQWDVDSCGVSRFK